MIGAGSCRSNEWRNDAPRIAGGDRIRPRDQNFNGPQAALSVTIACHIPCPKCDKFHVKGQRALHPRSPFRPFNRASGDGLLIDMPTRGTHNQQRSMSINREHRCRRTLVAVLTIAAGVRWQYQTTKARQETTMMQPMPADPIAAIADLRSNILKWRR